MYCEASSSCLSLGGFPWREVVVQGLPGFSSIEAAGKTEARELSGGFHYKGSVGRLALQKEVHPVVSSQLCTKQQIRAGLIEVRIHTVRIGIL